MGTLLLPVLLFFLKMASSSRLAQFARKIVCVGRNYTDHIAELGNTTPVKPMLFMKPPSTYIKNGTAIEIPLGCKEVHHEIELGIVIGSPCSRVHADKIMDHVGGYALALDMTCRDFQNELKAKGHPWELAKCFDTSCPISDLIRKEAINDPHDLNLVCKVNGELRQNESTGLMIYKIPELISYISQYYGWSSSTCSSRSSSCFEGESGVSGCTSEWC